MKKKQHFIQKKYLEAFADDSKLFCFEPANKKWYQRHIDNVAETNKFYSIPLRRIFEILQESDKRTIDDVICKAFTRSFFEMDEADQLEVEESIENLLGNFLEPEFLDSRKNLVKLVDEYMKGREAAPSLPVDLKRGLCRFAALGYLRTAAMRQDFSESTEEYFEQISAIESCYGAQEINNKDDNKWTKDRQKMHHLSLLMEEICHPKMSAALLTRRCLVAVNQESIPLVVSDRFITLNPTQLLPKMYGYGIASPGMEAIWPITNELIIFICDPALCSGKGDFFITTQDLISQMNDLIISNCYERCFCKSFEPFEEYLKRNH